MLTWLHSRSLTSTAGACEMDGLGLYQLSSPSAYELVAPGNVHSIQGGARMAASLRVITETTGRSALLTGSGFKGVASLLTICMIVSHSFDGE
jgi:hypothetical protein